MNMKKINIYMDDMIYASNLQRMLNTRYFDINADIIESSSGLDEGILTITDKKLNGKFVLYLYDEKLKYQSIDNIYDLIIKEFENHDLEVQKSSLISFVNLSEMRSENPIITNLALQISKNHKTLLVNYNNFHKYKFNNSEIGLENILFSIEDDIDLNQYKNLYYLNSSNLPLQTNIDVNYKKILEAIKKLNFKYIFLDICFDLNQRNLEIIKNSDKIIYYINDASDINYIENILNYLTTINDKDIIELRQEDSEIIVKNKDGAYSIKDLAVLEDLI